MKLGVAGIGKMGASIAARLSEVGHDVTVWNRTPDKAKAVAGAKIVANPTELAENCETVITILTDAAALDAVYNGPSGLLHGKVAAKLFIDMSTVLPATEIALAEAVRAQGAAFVECPVGGSTGPARQGKLIGLMGAEPADAARARPILEQLCRRLEHAGPVGSGSVLKFTINLPLMVYWQALGEALAMARTVAIEPERLMDLLSDTSGTANVLKYVLPASHQCSKAAPPERSHSMSTARLRTCNRCSRKPNRAGSSCRWSSGRSAATRKPGSTAPAMPKSLPCRFIGPAAIISKSFKTNWSCYVR